MATPSVFPTSVDLALSGPGKVEVLTLSQIPSSARVSARLALDPVGDAVILFDQVTVFDVVEVTIPGGSPDLPPGHAPDEPQTVTDLVQVASSDGTTPVSVTVGQVVKLGLDARGIRPGFRGVTGVLRIDGDTWDPVVVPIRLTRLDEAHTTLGVTELVVRPGTSATTDATVSWVAGPAVSVDFHLVPDSATRGITLIAPSLVLQPGESKAVTLVFQVAPEAALGVRVLRVIQGGGLPRELVMHLQVVGVNTPLPIPLDPNAPLPTGPSGAVAALRELERARRAIEAKRALLGDVTGPPTSPPGDPGVHSLPSGGFVREFFRGAFYFNHRVADEAFFVGRSHAEYRRLGGPGGHLGWPVSDDRPDEAEPGGAVGVTRFQHGAIYWWPDIGALEMRPVVLRFAGLHCFGTTSGLGSDEPYATFGVVSVTGERSDDPPQTRIFEGVDRGESRGDAIELFRGLPFGLTLVMTLSEHDEGDPLKYKDEVGNLVEKVGDVIAEALTVVPFVGAVLSVAASIGFALAGPTLAGELAELLGTDDDFIGTDQLQLTGKDLMRMARDGATDFDGVGLPASFASPLLSGDGGSYKLYFTVEGQA